MTSSQERLAALRARHAGTTPAPLVTSPAPEAAPASPPPVQECAATIAAPQSTGTPVVDTTTAANVTGSEPKRRGRPPRAAAPTALTGAGINPPEGVEALAQLTAEGPSATTAPTPAPVTAPSALATLDVLVEAIRLRLPKGTTITVAALGILLALSAVFSTPAGASGPAPKTALVGVHDNTKLLLGVMSSEGICKVTARQLTEYAQTPPDSGFVFVCVDPALLLTGGDPS